MSPDRALQGELDERLLTRVRGIESAMTEDQVAAAGAAAAELEQLNSTPNTPAQLASLPQLQVADLPAALQHVDTEVRAVAGVTLLRNDLFSNGVNYLVVDFDLTGLPAELWPYLPRYLEATEKLGVAGADYEAIARRKAAATGGVRASLSLSHHGVHAERTLRGVRFSLKALDDQMEEALALLGSLVFGGRPARWRAAARGSDPGAHAVPHRPGARRRPHRRPARGTRSRPGRTPGGNRQRPAAARLVRGTGRALRTRAATA